LLRVLTYHRIAEPGHYPWLDPSLISATPTAFDQQMLYLSKNYRAVSIDDVLNAIENRQRLHGRSVLITFDDGYKDFAEYAWPILRKYALPAVLFVPTAYPGNPERRFWWDRLYYAMASAPDKQLRDTLLGIWPNGIDGERIATLKKVQCLIKATPHKQAMDLIDKLVERLAAGPPPRSSVLNWDELRDLEKQGVAIGAHTHTHPILTRMSQEEISEEVHCSQTELEQEIRTVRPIFCYPSGEHDGSVVRILEEEGFKAAFTTRDGQNDLRVQDPLQLRRTNITRRTTLRVFRLRLWRLISHVDAFRHRRKITFSSRHLIHGGIQMQPASAETIETRISGNLMPSATLSGLKVAYVMSRFPKLTETFILYEILELYNQGVQVEVYPLLRQRETVTHQAAERLLPQIHFRPFLSISVLMANLHFIRRRPLAYIKAWFEVLWGTLGSARFFAGAVIYFPKVVRFAYEMSQSGVQHIHAHFANHPALAALIIHRLTGIPYSFTAHGSDIHRDTTMLARKVAAAEYVISISKYNKELIVEECGEQLRNKIHVIHCGVDPNVFAPCQTPTDRPLQIICVGSLVEVKGHKYLIEACRILKSRGIDFLCHMVGNGPLRAALEKQIKEAGLNDRINMHGALPRMEVASRMAGSDVMALTSALARDGQREGIPVVLMEAMASGLPVVASRLSGIPELVESGKTGFLVPPGDPVAIAEALETLARDKQLRIRMGRAGREKALREFNLRQSATRLLAYFRNGAPGLEMRHPAGKLEGFPIIDSLCSRSQRR
jgi:glycosyltransferase involved in cell wall biosynthesis/peptidoglycan/xylan/chitin deacetylase (PgdA/CDA1 family)